MKKPRTVGKILLAALAIVAMGASPLQAVTATWYVEFNGAYELWNWDTDGKTQIGGDVTASTLPEEMQDPAKVRIYAAGGTLEYEFRNYRPQPNGYQSILGWKTTLPTGDGLVAWNLSVMGPPSGILDGWGQKVGATDVLGPTAAPDYDNVGTNWFAQDNGGMPTWWCEAQADALGKDDLDPKRFTDFVVLEFDDTLRNPDGTVSLWIGGFVTGNLAGLEVNNAAYAVLEGRMKRPAMRDDDGDGYFASPWGNDCCDDPYGPCAARGGYTQDPPICATCVCGDAECAPCARCIRPGAFPEIQGDGIDTNCNGEDDCFMATASFGTEMEGKLAALQDLRDRYLLQSDLGRRVVDLYYGYSPPVASYVDSRPELKAAVRTALLPVVGAAWAMSHKGAVAGLALGMVALGLVLRRKERMSKTMVLLLAAGFLAMAPLSAEADVRADMDAVIQQSGSCLEAVDALLDAGYPEAEVIPAVLAGCRDGVADVIASAIRSGADPFTVAYAAKGAGVDLREVVSALEGVSGGSAPAGGDATGFQPPLPPIGISSAPVVVTGTGSSWGQTKFVASPSL